MKQDVQSSAGIEVGCFSTPIHGFAGTPLLHELASTYFASLQEILEASPLVRADEELQRAVLQIREATSIGSVDFDGHWSPGAGLVCEGLRRRNGHLVRVGVSLELLHLATRVPGVSFELSFELPVALLIEQVLLPTKDHIQVVDRNGIPHIRVGRDGTPMSLPEWTTAVSEPQVTGATKLPGILRAGVQLTIVPDGLVSPPSGGLGLDAISSRSLAAFDEALDVLATVAPPFLDWVLGVTRRLQIQASVANSMVSGTVSGYLGFTYLSETTKPFGIAEMFVHESSHQYFHLVEMLGPIHNPNFVDEFYSPFPRQMRQLTKLLLAYHAFANVRLLYDRLDAAGHRVDDGLVTLTRQLADVQAVLASNRHQLTELGRELFDPLSLAGGGIWH